MSRVLIADDHAVVRSGYKQFLEGDTSIVEIGEAANGQETLEQLRTKEWDLLLMDIHMPDRSGLDILQHVSATYPAVRVLVMSGLPEEQYARNVLRAGASGYLSKGGSPQEFLKAVRQILSGRRYVSATLAESMAADIETNRDQDLPQHGLLSPREFQIFCKLADGATVTGIAAELALSVKTISTYRTRIMEKTKLKTNADIIRYAVHEKLVE